MVSTGRRSLLCFLIASAFGCSGGEPSNRPASADGGASSLPVGGRAGAPSSAAGASSGAGGAATAGTAGAGNAGANASGGISGQAGAGEAGAVHAAGSSTAGDAGGEGGEPSVDPALLPAVTVHLAGDSTVMTYAAGSLQEGWGQELGAYLLSKVTIDNQAIGGASVRTFHDGSRWTNIMNLLHEGDYVLAAFGANDSGTVAGRHVDPADYQAIYGKMAEEVGAKHASFVIVTPSALQEWSGGVEKNARLGPYVAALTSLSQAKPLPLADLNARSVEYLNLIGQQAAREIYIDGDKAHFTKKGASQMAQFVAQELHRIKSPLGQYLR
jgi:lysophospholipase L1-like esterase